MSTNQVDQAATTVVTEMGHIHGLNEITQVFDKAEIALILATGIRKLHEYQCLKGKQEEADNHPVQPVREKSFGANRRNIIKCSQGYKYRYPKGIPTKVQFYPKQAGSRRKTRCHCRGQRSQHLKHQL